MGADWFAAVCKQSFCSFVKMVLYNVLETISIFSFAKQMMLREFGVFKGGTP
ncbi:hypothetical protein X926_09605 [Petrotoga sp. HWHPT.55.6.3]|nr:hypothetical protein X926_09605 [Petrotoga sp. HWHPT.55.6.3]